MCLLARSHQHRMSSPASAEEGVVPTKDRTKTQPWCCCSNSFLALQALHCRLDPEQWAHLLNGAVVGLACSSRGPAEPTASQLEAATEAAAPLAAAAASAPLHCLGMGIVRGMDMAKQLIYLLTPLSQSQLERVTRLQV